MEVNFIIILVIIVIGFSIPIVICGYVFLLIWGPKILRPKKKSGLHGQESSLGNMFQSTFQMPRSFRMGPCGNCKLIDSGDVAFYGVTCPECGEVPPSKKHLHRGIGRLLLNVQQNAAAPALVAANDARDNQQSDTPGVSPSRLAVVNVDFEK